MEIIYKEPIASIHNEINECAENALKEAKRILNEAQNIAREKAERLIAVGFKQAKEAHEITKLTKDSIQSEKDLEAIRYYRQKYPQYKFILLRDVKAICEKYKLVYAPIELYTGFVPENKLIAIENFRVDVEDRQLMIVVWKNLRKAKTKLSKFTTRQINMLKKGKNVCVKKLVSGRWRTWRNTLIYCLESLQIIAPQSMIDMRGMRVRKHKVEVEFKDPVVLHPVRGGYLVMAAWGDEASDVNVVNEKMN